MQRYKILDSHGNQKTSKDMFHLKVKESYQTDSVKGSASLDIHKKLNSVWLRKLAKKTLKAKGYMYGHSKLKLHQLENQAQICWVKFLSSK